MENIDPVLLLQPVVAIAFCSGVVIYWRSKHRLTLTVLWATAAAYFVAVISKNLLILATVPVLYSAYGHVSVPVGLYFGTMTSVFEIGIAYVVARLLVARKRIFMEDAAGYGIGLGFWENGVYLGALSLVSTLTLYAAISSGALPESAYGQLVQSQPILFSPPPMAAGLVALGSLERVSSFILHSAFGYLCVLSACSRRWRFFAAAFPMGYIDALVPFASSVPSWEFEAILFLIAMASLGVAWKLRPKERLAYPQDAGAS